MLSLNSSNPAKSPEGYSDLTEEQVDTILGVFLFFSTLAVLAQLFTLIFYYLYVDLRSPRNFCYRLVFLLSLSDIVVWGMRIESNLERIFTGYTAYDYSIGYCAFLGVLWNFFLLLNILITFVISFCLVVEIIFGIDNQKYEKYFYVIIIIYSLLFSLLPLYDSKAYGVDDQIKCWITDHEDSKYRYLGFYGHLWVIFILNTINILIILWKLRSLGEIHAALVKKLIWFPIIMFIFWIEPSVRRISDHFERFGEKNYELALIQYISMPAQGVANAIVYGCVVNKRVREKFIDFFRCRWSNLKENLANTEISSSSEASLMRNDSIQN